MEEVYLKDYRTFEEAQQNIGEFIEEVYTTRRDCTPASDIYRR